MLISVVICTHDPRPEYLARVLEALRAQTDPVDRWELILIDNGSAAPLEGAVDLSWHPRGRVVREEQLGLTPARLRGIAEAAGDLVLFVDDDNILAPDYLEQARAIAEGWPALGVWSGRVDPEYEVEPPGWFTRYEPMVAIRRQDREAWSNVVALDESNPTGAGMCVRRAVAQVYAEAVATDPRRRSLDRRGGSLSSCGDLDLAFLACGQGWGMGLFPRLRLTHIIPAGRLDLGYLARLMEEGTRSNMLLMHLHDATGGLPKLPRLLKLRAWFAGLRMERADRVLHNARVRGQIRGLNDLRLDAEV